MLQNSLLANVNQAKSFGDFLQVFRDLTNGGYFALLADGTVESLAPGTLPSDGSMGPTVVTAPLVWSSTGIVTGVIAAGTPFRILAEFTNTGATTLAIGGQAAAPIIHPDGSALVAGDIVAGQIILLVGSAAGLVFAGVEIGNGKFRSRQTILSAAILTSFTTPITVVPNIITPGASILTAVLPHSCTILNNFGGVAYTANAAGVVIQYITSNNITGLIFSQAFMQAAADAIALSSAGVTMVTPVTGEGLEFISLVANPAAGTGVLEIDTEFSFVNFTT